MKTLVIAFCFMTTMGWCEMKDLEKYIEVSSETYFVSQGTTTWTLEDFVRSGKFCEIFGHTWIKDHTLNRETSLTSTSKDYCKHCPLKRVRKVFLKEQQ